MSRMNPQQRLAQARQRAQAARQPARGAMAQEAPEEPPGDEPPATGQATLTLTGQLVSADGSQSWPVTLSGEVPLDAIPGENDEAVRTALEQLRRALGM